MQKQYPYSPAYQQQVFALMLQDPTFLPKFSSAIKPAYFSNDDHVSLAQLILDHFGKHYESPTKDVLDAQVIDFCRQAGIDQTILNRLRGAVDQACRIPIQNKDAIIETISNWAQVQEVSSAVEKSIGIIATGKTEEIETLPELFRNAISAGFSQDMGVEFFAEAERLPDLAKTDALFDPRKRVPFPLHTITQNLGGGTGPGEIAIILGESKIGKSIWLANVAAFASSLHHKNVVYITNELKAPQVMLRVACRLTGIPEEEILRGHPEYLPRIKQYLQQDNRLHIQYYTPDTATVETIRNYCSQLYLIHRVKPDLLIVDDADNVREAGYKDTEGFHKLGKIYKQLIAVGDEFECAVHTASQFNREGYAKKDDPEFEGDAQHIQGSIAKVQQATLSIGMFQTKEEKLANVCRISVLRSRRGPDKYTIACDINKRLMIITEKEKKVEVPDAPPPPPPPPSAPQPPPPKVAISR